MVSNIYTVEKGVVVRIFLMIHVTLEINLSKTVNLNQFK